LDLAPFIDHTNLDPAVRKEDILKLCDEALEMGFASVCVNPCYVSLASEKLKGSG
jgi:deoxyribose-phosphate aldolase